MRNTFVFFFENLAGSCQFGLYPFVVRAGSVRAGSRFVPVRAGSVRAGSVLAVPVRFVATLRRWAQDQLWKQEA